MVYDHTSTMDQLFWQIINMLLKLIEQFRDHLQTMVDDWYVDRMHRSNIDVNNTRFHRKYFSIDTLFQNNYWRINWNSWKTSERTNERKRWNSNPKEKQNDAQNWKISSPYIQSIWSKNEEISILFDLCLTNVFRLKYNVNIVSPEINWRKFENQINFEEIFHQEKCPFKFPCLSFFYLEILLVFSRKK